MKMSKEKRALIAGMIGCSLYVIGDFLFAATGKTQSTESIGLMVKVAYLDMATWRMVVSIICGVLGTALYYIGFHQMWKLLKRHLTQLKQQKWVKLFQTAYLTGTARTRIFLQPHRFYGDCGKSLHASAVAAGSDRSRHGIRRTPAGFGIGAGFAAGEGKMRRM